ncbi:MAG: protein kinase [Bacteroidetes bacterium]|nr:protein kinase [Bacteroidota bacterium]
MQTTEMTPERWRRIEELLDVVLDMKPDDRKRYISDFCQGDASLEREVMSFVRADRDAPPFIDAADSHDGDPFPAGTRIDAYRISRLIGKGGMGLVYEAERADGSFDQTVAIKIVQGSAIPGPARRRSEHERQILATLNHPNIARLYDGGYSESGVPYFVMEMVDGTPIDQYCDERQLSVKERLRLFVDVCNAVDFAHHNLVIHRDLKPGNILVTPDGTVKLLDFGIAKILADDSSAADVTAAGVGRALTPGYAAPEQVRGEAVTTASDVYALGVMLYGILAGSPPYVVTGTSPMELQRAVCDTVPDRPSTVFLRKVTENVSEELEHARSASRRAIADTLKGDLDNIVLTALRKEAERRYQTAGRLRDDIVNFLENRPVSATADSISYRVRKFVRRNRVGVALGALAATLAVVGVSGVLWQSHVAREGWAAASLEATKAQRTADFLVSVFSDADPYATPPESLTARDVLDRGSNRILDELSSEPAVQAELLTAISRAYMGLGEYAKASEYSNHALALAAQSEHSDAAIADMLLIHAHSLQLLGQHAAADTASAEALKLARASRDDQLLQKVLAQRGFLLAEYLSRYDEAVEARSEALEIKRRLRGNDDVGVAIDELELASTMHYTMQMQESTALTEHAVSVFEQSPRDVHPITYAQALQSLGLMYGYSQRRDQAIDMYRRAIELRREALGPDHPTVAFAMTEMAGILQNDGQLDRAGSVLRESIQILERGGDDAQSGLPDAYAQLGENQLNLGNLDEATALMKRAIGSLKAAGQEETMRTVMWNYSLGKIYLKTGDNRKALTLIGDQINPATNLWGENFATVIDMNRDYALALSRLGNVRRADSLMMVAVSRASELKRNRDNRYSSVLLTQARMYYERGDCGKAVAPAEQAVAIMDRIMGDDSSKRLSGHTILASCYLDSGRRSDAEMQIESVRAIIPRLPYSVPALEREVSDLELRFSRTTSS